jgi:hypothetical protein
VVKREASIGHCATVFCLDGVDVTLISGYVDVRKKNSNGSVCCRMLLCSYPVYRQPYVPSRIVYTIIILIINIKGLAIWPVPSPELQLLSPAFLRSPNFPLSLWSILV